MISIPQVSRGVETTVQGNKVKGGICTVEAKILESFPSDARPLESYSDQCFAPKDRGKYHQVITDNTSKEELKSGSPTRHHFEFFFHAFTKDSLSRSVRPTLLLRPKLASASPILSSTTCSSGVTSEPPSPAPPLEPVSSSSSEESAAFSTRFETPLAAWLVLAMPSAMRTRTQWVGRLSSFHRKAAQAPGTGVVTSGGV